MPKPMYVWTGTAWVSVASEVESLATYATQSYADAQPGMKLVVPSSVAVGSGSGSVGTSGVVTFSGATSVSLNNCFSSTYDNYRIIYNINTTASADVISLRLRVGGSDASGATDYRWSIMFMSGTSAPANNGGSSTGQSSAGFINTTTSSGMQGSADFYSPFLTKPTMGTRTGVYTNLGEYGHFLHTPSTSYDGFTLFSAQSLTGTVAVYGYKD